MKTTKIKVTSGGKEKSFAADDFRVGQDGGLSILRAAKVEGGTLTAPEETIVAFRSQCWDSVEKCCEEAKDAKAGSGT